MIHMSVFKQEQGERKLARHAVAQEGSAAERHPVLTSGLLVLMRHCIIDFGSFFHFTKSKVMT